MLKTEYSFDDRKVNKLLEKSSRLTTGVIYQPVVIKGTEFPEDPSEAEVAAVAIGLNCQIPPIEVASLLSESLSGEDLKKMGVEWLVVMHEPIVIEKNDGPFLGTILHLSICPSGPEWWHTAECKDDPDEELNRNGGWIFLAPIVKSEKLEQKSKVELIQLISELRKELGERELAVVRARKKGAKKLHDAHAREAGEREATRMHTIERELHTRNLHSPLLDEREEAERYFER